MLSIVQIGKYYFPTVGGIENNVRQLAHACAGRFTSAVISMQRGAGPREEFHDDGVRVFRLRSYGNIWRQEIVESPEALLRQLRPDAIHFHTPNPLLASLTMRYVRRNPEVRVIVSHHADLQRPWPVRSVADRINRQLLEHADVIIAYTRTFAENSTELVGHLNKLKIIPHGVALPDDEMVRNARSPQKRAPMFRLGFLGRVERWKGISVMLEALALDEQSSLLVAGEGSYRRQLERTVHESGLAERVRFTGAVTGVVKEEFFDRIDCLVLPSLHTGESYGQVLVEAQLRGIPVMASDLPTGIREICDEGRAGLLFPVGDARAIAACLDRLRQPGVYSAVAAAGLARARRYFAEPVVRDRIISFYQSLFDDKRRETFDG